MNGPQIELLVTTHLAVCVIGAMAGGLWVTCVQNPRTERRKAAMTEDDKPKDHARAKVAGVVLAVLALIGVGVSDAWYNAQHHSDQNAIKAKADARETQRQFAHYQHCVNDYTRAQHNYQVASRRATSDLQAKQETRDEANSVLWRLVTRSLASGKPVPKQVALNALGRYNAAAAEAKAAKLHLDKVRAAHPVPDPPAVACPPLPTKPGPTTPETSQ